MGKVAERVSVQNRAQTLSLPIPSTTLILGAAKLAQNVAHRVGQTIGFDEVLHGAGAVKDEGGVDIAASTEQLIESKFTEEKRIEDGWEYVLDNNGNVAKDSLGNDIKRTVYKIITADVKEVKQLKQGNVLGSFDIIDRKKQQVLKSVDFNEALIFENIFATVSGNENALSNETKGRIRGRFVPFPSDQQMIIDVSDILKSRMDATARANSGRILN